MIRFVDEVWMHLFPNMTVTIDSVGPNCLDDFTMPVASVTNHILIVSSSLSLTIIPGVNMICNLTF